MMSTICSLTPIINCFLIEILCNIYNYYVFESIKNMVALDLDGWNYHVHCLNYKEKTIYCLTSMFGYNMRRT